jgi:hypothetical protein
MKQPTEIAYVTWVDSIGIDGWSRDVPLSSMYHIAAGLLLEETEDSIVLTISAGGERWGDVSSFSPMRIPRSTISRLEKRPIPAWLRSALVKKA